MGFVVSIVSNVEQLMEAHRLWLPTLGRILLSLTFLEDAFRLATDFTAQAELLTNGTNMFTLPYPAAVGFVALCFCFQLLGGLLVLINSLVPFASALLLFYLWSSILVYGIGLPDELHHSGMVIYVVRVLALVGALLMLIADHYRAKQEKEFSAQKGLPANACTDGATWTRWLQFSGRFLLAIQCFQIIELVNRGANIDSTDSTWHHYSGMRITDPTPVFERHPRLDPVWESVPSADAGEEVAHSGECQEMCAREPACYLYTWRAQGRCIMLNEADFEKVWDTKRWKHVSTTVSGIKLKYELYGGKNAAASVISPSSQPRDFPMANSLHECYKRCDNQMGVASTTHCFIYTWFNTPKNDPWSRRCVLVSQDKATQLAMTDHNSWPDGDQHYTSILGYCFVASVLSLGVVIGFQTASSSLLIAGVLIAVNITYNGFWTATHPEHWDFLQYYFFQNISIFGGLLILISVGPGGFSFDEKKKD